MTSKANSTWLPAFGGQDWDYQSLLLVLPTEAELAADPKAAIKGERWAKGILKLTDNPDDGSASGVLSLVPGVKLQISVLSTPAALNSPVFLKITGIGLAPIAGCVYELVGWAFPGSDGKVESVRGAIQAARGVTENSVNEPGGRPIRTVGSFILVKAS